MTLILLSSASVGCSLLIDVEPQGSRDVNTTSNQDASPSARDQELAVRDATLDEDDAAQRDQSPEDMELDLRLDGELDQDLEQDSALDVGPDLDFALDADQGLDLEVDLEMDLGPDPAEVCSDSEGLTNYPQLCECLNGASRVCDEGLGECSEGGRSVCVAGRWGDCEDVPMATPERCDLRDNDCDGRTDEGRACPCTPFGDPERFWILCGALAPSLTSDEPERVTTWIRARNQCESYGLSLASIRSDAENQQALEMWAQLEQSGFLLSNPEGIWTGLHDRGDGSGFLWLNDTSSYRRWDMGEPNSGAVGGEACGAILIQPEPRRSFWDDRDCESTYMYLCEGP